MDLYFSLVEGKISALSNEHLSGLIDIANQSVKRGSSSQLLVFDKSLVFEDWVRWWLERIVNNEPIGELTAELNERIRGIRFIRLINHDEHGEPKWENIAVMAPGTPTDIKAAHAVSLFVVSGYLKKLRRCQADGCELLFLGPANRKWCSENCGSRMRGRRLRKKNRRQRYTA